MRAGLRPSVVAGHSVGEYAALFASGFLSFADALRLVRARGEIMQSMHAGTMAAVLGLELDMVERACDRARPDGVVVVANVNAPKQIVVSGEAEAVAAAGKHARDAGAVRVVPLNVGGAFHSPLMRPAAETLMTAMEALPFRRGTVPIVSNVDATATTEPEEVRAKLEQQLYSPVKWVDCIHALRAYGATRCLEIGPGKVLTGLLRQIDRSIPGISVNLLAAAQQEVDTSAVLARAEP